MRGGLYKRFIPEYLLISLYVGRAYHLYILPSIYLYSNMITIPSGFGCCYSSTPSGCYSKLLGIHNCSFAGRLVCTSKQDRNLTIAPET